VRRYPVIAAFCLLTSVNADAQVPCVDTDTIDLCLSKNMQAARGGTSTETVRAAARETTPGVTELFNKLAADAFQPGSQSGGGNQTTSTITDLIPWLSMLGLVSDSDASDGTLALDLNFLLPIARAPTGNDSQLKWVLNLDPEPYAPLVEAFDESVREARKATLDKELDDTADSELQYTWSLVTDQLGRDFRRHHETLNALFAPAIFSVLRSRTDDPVRRQFIAAINDFLNDPNLDLGADPGDLTLGDPKVAPLRARLLQLLQTSGTALGLGQKATIESLRTQLAATRLPSLSRLVLLQPQLLFSATRRFRDDLVGPSAWGAKISYEKSFASFGDFMARSRSVCSETALTTRNGEPVELDQAQACYAALGKYLDAHESDIENEDRISVSVEYRKVDAISYSYPVDGVALSVPKTDRLIGSIGYGRALSGGAAKDRFDFKADYDSNLSGDQNGKSRFVVSATYTRDIMGVTVPFSLVYANKSEFLGDVDKQISLHAGLKYQSAAPEQ
jgi:hypothetical protein